MNEYGMGLLTIWKFYIDIKTHPNNLGCVLFIKLNPHRWMQ